MINTIRQYIASNNLPKAPSRIIVTVSGGADSVALLHILIELGYDCYIAHCNFKLRKNESDRDAKFVETLSEELNLPFLYKEFDTETYAKENKISIEMSARELRYNWFEELRDKHNAEAIAVAHHADDSIETFLMNITRGTGIHGLTGIKAQNGYIIRPLLAVSRIEIETYLSERNISFVTDSTNLEQVYKRNKFRNSIIPALEELNPSFKNTITETIQRLSEVENIYNNFIINIKKEIVYSTADRFSINIPLLKKQKASASILYEILSPIGFSNASIQLIRNNLDGESGKQYFSSTHRIIKDRETLLVSINTEREEETVYKIEESQKSINQPISIDIAQIKVENCVIKKNKQYAFLDIDMLKFPLTLRKWHEGDFFIPFGMQGKKKLSDYYIDKKFSLAQKENSWVVVSEENIVWLVGERIDQRYSIRPESKRILKLKYTEK